MAFLGAVFSSWRPCDVWPTLAIAFATPPRSGPFCTMSACVTAPYTDVAVFFPRDYVWMYPALLLWLFITGFTLALGSLIILSLLYGPDLEYRFEVAVISIDWLVLIISGLLVSIVFNRAGRDQKS
jgi:hypothetical protein